MPFVATANQPLLTLLHPACSAALKGLTAPVWHAISEAGVSMCCVVISSNVNNSSMGEANKVITIKTYTMLQTQGANYKIIDSFTQVVKAVNNGQGNEPSWLAELPSGCWGSLGGCPSHESSLMLAELFNGLTAFESSTLLSVTLVNSVDH